MESPPASDSPILVSPAYIRLAYAFARLMTLVGIGIILYGCVRLWQTHDFVARAVHAQASVVDYKVWLSDRDHSKSYQPIVRFVDPAGKSWEKNVGNAERRRAFPFGHLIEIVYVPEHPNRFVPNTWGDIWSGAWGCVGLGAFVVLLWSILTVYARNKLRHPGEYHLAWWDLWFVPLKRMLRLLGQ